MVRERRGPRARPGDRAPLRPLVFAGGDRQGAERQGLQRRGARLVHGESRHFLQRTAADGNLACRIWSAAGLARVAEDGFFDLFRLDSASFYRSLGGNDPQVSGG